MDRLDPEELQRDIYFYTALIEDYEKNQKTLIKLLQGKNPSVKPQSLCVEDKSFDKSSSNNFNRNSQSSALNNHPKSFLNKINKPAEASVQNTSVISNIDKHCPKSNFVTTHKRTVINRPNTSTAYYPNVKPNIHSSALNTSKRTVLVRNNSSVPKKAHPYPPVFPNRTVLFTGASGSSRNSALLLHSSNTSKQIITKHNIDKIQNDSLKGKSSTLRTVLRPGSELKTSDKSDMKKPENRSQIMNEILALTQQLKEKTSNLKNTKGLPQVSSAKSNQYKKSSSSANRNFIPLKQNHHESVKGEKASTVSNSYASFLESLQKLNSKPSVRLGAQDDSVISTENDLNVDLIDAFTQKIKPSQITSKPVQNVSENITITRINQPKRNLHIHFSQQKSSNSTSCQIVKLPKTNINPESVSKNKLNSKKKVLSSKYKVINKNVSVSLGNKDRTPRKEKIKDLSTPVVHNRVLQRHSASKSKKKLNSKYKIINRTPRHILQKSFLKLDLRDNEKKPIAKYYSYKSVSKSNKNVQNNLRRNIVQSPSFIKKGKRIKSIHKIINVSPTMKVKSKLPASLMKRSGKKSCVLKSKYKVVNKSLLSPANVFMKELRLQGSSSGNSWRSWEGISPIFGRQNTPKNRILVKRLYKSKRTIINKNSSPISQTARMIKTKYFSLNKRRPLSFHQYAKSSTSIIFKRYSSSRSYYAKSRSFQPRTRAAFYDPTLRSFKTSTFRHSQHRSVNRYAKVNTKGKRKHVFISATFNRSKKSRNSPRRSSFKISSPVAQTLASRVLHRSIHRASKKKTKKVNAYCMFYNRFGRCNRGVQCTFIHDPSKIAVCTRFLRGTCRLESCPFSHEVCPGKMALCSFFLLGTCSRGDACPYTHRVLTPDAKLCRAFVQGHCPHGRKCQKAHILICPQYVAGICEKGDSCVFPHPPQKLKKDLPQESKESVNNQEIEELMENVNRYFQTFTEGYKESDGIKLVVPRRRALPEQPSFIPLCELVQESQSKFC